MLCHVESFRLSIVFVFFFRALIFFGREEGGRREGERERGVLILTTIKQKGFKKKIETN